MLSYKSAVCWHSRAIGGISRTRANTNVCKSEEEHAVALSMQTTLDAHDKQPLAPALQYVFPQWTIE
jgi:hypothetical protein